MTTESPELKSLLASLMHPGLKAIDLSLGRTERHLAAIGNPEAQLPPMIHVAGTNGKGSTIAFLRAMLQAAGKRCHVFTSPHLVHFKERFVVAGAELSEPEIMEALEQIKARSDAYPLTFFEANAVAAFELFARAEADYTLLEVGMGGRFDATNVVTPKLCIITPVSMDHEQYLGDTLAKIAYEKAGIIKQGVPVIVAPQAPEAMEVIAQVAAQKKAPLMQVNVMHWESLSLQGEHQHINASVAAKAAQHVKIDHTSIQTGLQTAHWRGRLQKLTHGPLIEATRAVLWLDGGHNEAAAQMLSTWVLAQAKPVYLICAMSDQKDPKAFINTIAPTVASVSLIEIPDEPLSFKAETLAQFAPKNSRICANIEQAVAALPADSIGLIAGSLYLAGSVLEKNG
jgi:dihydrofolate synthase/folylpolyglutamate synthase